MSADFSRIADEFRAVDVAGGDWIHVDVMDGRFVPNITIGPIVLKAVRKATGKPVDVHLMIVEPEHYLEKFSRVGWGSSARPLRAEFDNPPVDDRIRAGSFAALS